MLCIKVCTNTWGWFLLRSPRLVVLKILTKMMGGLVLSSLIAACLALSLATAQVNDRPIIGVYTQPSDANLQQYGEQFIAASYVKFIEGAGARVVPIRYIPPLNHFKSYTTQHSSSLTLINPDTHSAAARSNHSLTL